MTTKQATIFLCTTSDTKPIPLTEKIICEQIIINICKQLQIRPRTRYLFGLRILNTKIWLSPVSELTATRYEFRARFKPANIQLLKKTDYNAYDYYFYQARYDVRNYMLNDIVYDNVKRELLGLGVADMYRTMIEKQLSIDDVLNDYKKFISKEVVKHHKFFIKKPVRDSLIDIKKRGHDANFVKGEYLKQLELMAPEYLSEDYNALMDRAGSPCRVILRVSPHNKDFPGVRVCYDSQKKEWELISSIEDLCFILISNDGTVQISRKTGIPTYLKFESIQIMQSFVSLLDGYYRLMVKWTFNLCKEMITPTMKRLHELKSHGPVGGEFSYAKLEEKRQNQRGCYILRECEVKYNVFYIDVCLKNGAKPQTYKLEKINDEEYIFKDDVVIYKNINELRTAYNKVDGQIYLKECLPSSEYDKSPLLLCSPDSMCTETLTDSAAVSAISSFPVVIHPSNLQVYKGQMKKNSNGTIVVHRSIWRLTKGKKIEVAMKVLKLVENDNIHLKDFMNRASQWAGLREGSKGIVRMWGICLSNPTALILEYANLGPLPQYLIDCRTGERDPLDKVDLIEAASHLASALWHLEEHKVVHGRIRCSKLLVFSHDENSFNVKLTDTGIHIPYTRDDIPWLPIECYSNFELARFSHAADVWAFATTVWEMYILSEESENEIKQPMQAFLNGFPLRKPINCPNNIYKILAKCWYDDSHIRIRPQEIMRDINQLLLSEVFDSRRKRPYATLFTKNFSDTPSLSSVNTDNTYLDQCDELTSVNDMSENNISRSLTSILGSGGSFSSSSQWSQLPDFDANNEIPGGFDILSSYTNQSYDDIDAIQNIFELDSNLQVVLQGRIGQGFYGEVYKGSLDTREGKREPRMVAVKRLKSKAILTSLIDFEREIAIMKQLQHPNIVQLLTSVDAEEHLIIMEYVPHGSLQSYLKINRDNIVKEQLINYCLEIARGMEYLAAQHIVHRDLAARNILVVDECHVKISDFGLAQVLGADDYYVLRTNRDLPIKWYALESLRDGKFSTKSDVWSYGVTLFEMFTFGEEPNLPTVTYDDEGQQQQQNILDALENGVRLACPSTCPQIVYTRIMYPCWKQLSHERPSFSEICSEITDLVL